MAPLGGLGSCISQRRVGKQSSYEGTDLLVAIFFSRVLKWVCLGLLLAFSAFPQRSSVEVVPNFWELINRSNRVCASGQGP